MSCKKCDTMLDEAFESGEVNCVIDATIRMQANRLVPNAFVGWFGKRRFEVNVTVVICKANNVNCMIHRRRTQLLCVRGPRSCVKFKEREI